MLEEMLAVDETASLDEVRAEMGRFLGLDEPVPAVVVRRAVEDPLYAHELVISRNAPGFLRALLNDPGNAAYAQAPAVAQPVEAGTEAIRRSNLGLAAKAAKALVKWGKGGFEQVDLPIYERRVSACKACPNLIDPPDQLAYRLIRGEGFDRKICNLCGCVASKKARLETETCPGVDPRDPSINRWGEPVR
jgi:hypothetical protein